MSLRSGRQILFLSLWERIEVRSIRLGSGLRFAILNHSLNHSPPLHC